MAAKTIEQKLRDIKRFDQLKKFLREELDWPIADFEDEADVTFHYEPEELGLNPKDAAQIEEIRQLRPIDKEPFGLFFIRFQRKNLPVTVMRRILRQLSIRKRQSSNPSERKAWDQSDLIFVSQWGDDARRHISFVHFQDPQEEGRLARINVLGWDDDDTDLKIEHVAKTMADTLCWRKPGENDDVWRDRWASAFEREHGGTIESTKDLSEALARLARRTRRRINTLLAAEHAKGPLTKLMGTFKDALIHDLDQGGFADMYAQTVAYGLLSAWLTGDESNRLQVPVTTPFLRELLETFMHGERSDLAIDFDELGITDVQALFERSQRRAILEDFGDRKPEEDPVIHFYEMFLHEYDPKEKKSRGVFYTPRPVVSFIVRSVDELLRTEFGLEDGLADTTTWGEMSERIVDLEIPKGATPDQPFVQILDPATGTGTFLVEVIELVHRTMREKWTKEGRLELQEQPALWNEYVEKHLLPRLFGYELMMAPYAIAHLKIGLTLLQTGYDFGGDSRVGVYLTNALEPATEIDEDLPLFSPALAHEAEAVNAIKRDQRFTVVIGNPPYSNYGQQNKNPWILSLIDDYKRSLNEKKLNLDDDYIKFLRLGHHVIDKSPLGLLAFITNHTYLDGVTHRRMREHLTQSFGLIRLLDLHGSVKKSEVTPDGSKDENVFDIQQGVSIGIFVRSRDSVSVSHSDLWGTRPQKYQWLSANSISTCPLDSVEAVPDRFYFIPHASESDSDYGAFVPITDIFQERATGFETARDHFAICFSEEDVHARLSDLLGNLSDAELRETWGLDDKRDWTLPDARDRLRKLEDPYEDVRDCCYRPFDNRFTHYDTATVTWPRKKVLGLITRANPALVVSRMIKGEEPHHFFIVSRPTEKIFISAKTSNNAFLLPMYRRLESATFFSAPPGSDPITPNIRDDFARAVSGGAECDTHEALGRLFAYIYGVFHSRQYRVRYAEFLRRDFPRVPIPASISLFNALSRIGNELISLHLMESSCLDRSGTKFLGSTDFQVEKVSYSDETVWIDKAKTRGFKGVPEEVWNFHIGGYQVCEKWLKDRQKKGGKNPRPGRVLSDEDIEHYQKIVVALSETIRIMGEIDEVIEAHGGWPGAFVIEPATADV